MNLYQLGRISIAFKTLFAMSLLLSFFAYRQLSFYNEWATMKATGAYSHQEWTITRRHYSSSSRGGRTCKLWVSSEDKLNTGTFEFSDWCNFKVGDKVPVLFPTDVRKHFFLRDFPPAYPSTLIYGVLAMLLAAIVLALIARLRPRWLEEPGDPKDP